MGWSQLGLNRRPFGLTADVDAYYPGSSAEAAHASLRTAFERREGFALLDGAPGVGKTYAALAWLERLNSDVPRVWLPNTHSSRPADLLQAILFDLDQPHEGLSEQELRLAVTAELIESLRTGRPLVLVIDEAQHLGAEALEELRLLSNIDSRYGKGLFAVLIGQPGLREALKPHEAFAQRLTTLFEMTPLSEDESREYLAHHIRRAGGSADSVLTEEAADLLVEHGAGLPRRLSLAAGLAFDVALAAGADAVDAEVVIEALEQLGLDTAKSEQPAPVLRSKGQSSKSKAGRKRAA